METVNRSSESMKLGYGDHSCLLYNNLDEYRYIAVDFIVDGLINNEMVISVIDEYPKDLLVEDLRDKGIDVEYFIECGQLLISSIKDVYYGNDGFNPNDTIDYWIKRFDTSKKEKYNGIRGIGEMLFALDGKQESIDKLIEYEIRCNIEVMPLHKNHTYLCIYNKNLFPLSVLEEVIKAHTVIINGNKLIKPNPYYEDSNIHLQRYNEKKLLRNFFNLSKDDSCKVINQKSDKEAKDIEILKYVLAATGDGVWELDIGLSKIYLSKSYFDMIGPYENEIQVGTENILKYIHPDDLIELNKKVVKCYNCQIQHLEHEIRVIGKEGEIIWLMIKGVPIKKDESGQILKMVGVYNNITESKNTNIQLATILKSTADAILVMDENRELIHFNQKFVDMWTIPEGLLKEGKIDLFFQYAKNKLTSPNEFIINQEETINSDIEKIDSLQLKDGRFIEIFCKPFILNGKDRYCVYSFRDISERKKAEELEREIIIKQKELQEIKKYEQLKTEFFSTVSHELKTPLNVIFAATQVLDSTRKGVKVDENVASDKYIKIMKQNCYRLIRLINNLIDINRLESGFMKIELRNYDIVSVVENITLSVADYIKSKNINIVFDTDTEEKIMACDIDMIERIILNLLSNSVKFTKESGAIEVNIYDKGENVIISVKDNGIGIPVEMQDVIFERFKQVDSLFSRRAEGSGIGLSLVKSLVELHEGNIKVESQLGMGSEFIIQLPVKNIEEDEHIINDEIATSSETYVERTLVEFSDIYS